MNAIKRYSEHCGRIARRKTSAKNLVRKWLNLSNEELEQVYLQTQDKENFSFKPYAQFGTDRIKEIENQFENAGDALQDGQRAVLSNARRRDEILKRL